jgi:hypothetical protein
MRTSIKKSRRTKYKSDNGNTATLRFKSSYIRIDMYDENGEEVGIFLSILASSSLDIRRGADRLEDHLGDDPFCDFYNELCNIARYTG